MGIGGGTIISALIVAAPSLKISGDRGIFAGDSLLIERIDTNDVGEPITWVYRLKN